MEGEPFPGDVYDELHVFPQEAWHSDAFLVGNRTGIMRLRDLCEKALADGKAVGEFMPNDGEGYLLNVHVVDEPTYERLWQFYRDEVAQTGPDNRQGDMIYPWDLP